MVLHMDTFAFIVEFVKVMPIQDMILMKQVKGENLQQQISSQWLRLVLQVNNTASMAEVVKVTSMNESLLMKVVKEEDTGDVITMTTIGVIHKLNFFHDRSGYDGVHQR